MESSTPQIAPGRQVVQAYRPGGFTISGVRHVGSVLVFPDRVMSWEVEAPGDLSLDRLQAIRAAVPLPDILVLGLGSRFSAVLAELRAGVRVWGPVLEPMATPAACRTYNVLLAEERRVAAALIALPA
jgi:uncharacterized protein